MNLGYSKPLFLLAFDHRGSFQKKFFGISGAPTSEEAARICDAKMVIFEGFLNALEQGIDRGEAGILVDEEFGADILRKARAEEVVYATAVEKSGQDEFDFQYGEQFTKHIEEFDPVFAKVLVRYNPEGNAEMNARQVERLRRLSEWLHDNNRRFLFELLVPATESQLLEVDGDSGRYDVEVRPLLMRQVIELMQQRGVEPDVWKIEGIDSVEDCAMIADQARCSGRDGVGCVVLGRGADENKVGQWLRAGTRVEGYLGFAIGRSIWWDALKLYVDGLAERVAVAEKISANYRHFIDVYRGVKQA